MNCRCDSKRYLLVSLLVAVAYFGLDMFFHHTCLGPMYQEYASLWRSMDQVKPLLPYAYAGYLLFGFLFVCIYSKGYEAGKAKWLQGIRYGLLLGLLFWGAGHLIFYPFTLYPARVLINWFVVGMTEFVILGLLTGLLYKEKG